MKRPPIPAAPFAAAVLGIALIIGTAPYWAKGQVFGEAKASPVPVFARTAAPSTRTSAITVGFSPGNAEAVVVRTIDGAKSSIRLAAYSFTSKPIATALIAAKKRGVDVRVVVDKSQRSERYTSATFLANMGIPVRVNGRYAIMHNKFMVVDGHTVQTGSFNYTASAARRNAENVVVVAGEPGMAATYDAEWRRLWGESDPYAARY